MQGMQHGPGPILHGLLFSFGLKFETEFILGQVWALSTQIGPKRGNYVCRAIIVKKPFSTFRIHKARLFSLVSFPLLGQKPLFKFPHLDRAKMLNLGLIQALAYPHSTRPWLALGQSQLSLPKLLPYPCAWAS